jgi:hypothetical protein
MKRNAMIMMSIGTIVMIKEKKRLKNAEILDGQMNTDVRENGFRENI